MGFDRHWQLWKWHTRRKYSAASAEQGPLCGDEAMENTFLYPHDKGAEALILLVRELLGLLADDLHTHGLDV